MFCNYHESEINELITVDRWAEQVYEAYRNAVREGTVEQFYKEADVALLDHYHMFIPKLVAAPFELLVESDYFDDQTHIIVLHHCRYTPSFTHAHEFFELSYLLDGTVDNIVCDQTIHMNQGDICIIPPYTEHSLVNCEGTLINILLKASSFDVIYQNILHTYGTALVSFLYNSIFCANIEKCYYIKNEWCPETVHEQLQLLILTKLRSTRHTPNDIQATAMMTSALTMLAEITPLQPSMAETKGVYKNQVTADILAFLKRNFKTATLQSVSQTFNYSPSYLSRLIKMDTNTNFVAILQRMKINEACHLLKTTDLPVAEIGLSIGFESCSSFYKAFKAQTGRTPHAYRLKP